MRGYAGARRCKERRDRTSILWEQSRRGKDLKKKSKNTFATQSVQSLVTRVSNSGIPQFFRIWGSPRGCGGKHANARATNPTDDMGQAQRGQTSVFLKLPMWSQCADKSGNHWSYLINTKSLWNGRRYPPLPPSQWGNRSTWSPGDSLQVPQGIGGNTGTQASARAELLLPRLPRRTGRAASGRLQHGRGGQPWERSGWHKGCPAPCWPDGAVTASVRVRSHVGTGPRFLTSLSLFTAGSQGHLLPTLYFLWPSVLLIYS